MPLWNTKLLFTKPEGLSATWRLRLLFPLSVQQSPGSIAIRSSPSFDGSDTIGGTMRTANRIDFGTTLTGTSAAYGYLVENLTFPYRLVVSFVNPLAVAERVLVTFNVTAGVREQVSGIVTLTVAFEAIQFVELATDTTMAALLGLANLPPWNVMIDRTDIREALAFSLWSEIESDTDNLALIVGDDTRNVASVTVRCRYDARLQPGFNVVLDRESYIVSRVQLLDRYRTLRLDLSRIV